MITLEPVTIVNRGDLEDIDAGAQARSWVHVPWYWHQQSLDTPTITCRPIHLDTVPQAVGMVAYGPAYTDETLTKRLAGAYELHHLVIDHRHQRIGTGRQIARAVVQMLAAQPDCERVLVAHHPDNHISRGLFLSLGFQPIEMQNYDGDPMLEWRPR